MKNLWNDREAAEHTGDLVQRAYTARLLGRDPSLVLHGGGNASVKVREKNIFGDQEDILYVKGSGGNMATIDTTGFSPCRMIHLLKLAKLEALTDTQMMDEFKASMTRLSAPAPSVEAILHAILPAKFVDHTHADVLIAVMNSPDGEARVREIYGDSVAIVPYVLPGFKLAKACAAALQSRSPAKTVGMVLLNHGIFTWGATAKESYDQMIELVGLAEAYLVKKGAAPAARPSGAAATRPLRGDIAAVRRAVSTAAGAPMIVATHVDPVSLGFAQRTDVAELSQRGAATPDHVIRTKAVPLVGRDVPAYTKSYDSYFAQHAGGRKLTRLDPAPRVILDAELGLCTAGRSAKEASVAADIYRQTIDIILQAEALGGWRPLPRQDLFDMEYWEPQQAKLLLAEVRPSFSGEVALVTGAASGIGKACVDSLLQRGAAVVGLDISPGITSLYSRTDFKGIVCDLTKEREVTAALEQAVRAFGGLDILILNAGIFPQSTPLAELPTEQWRKVIGVNLDATFALMRECHPLLKLALRGGRIAIIGSKNVPAPGPGAAAYSASKAAVNQLARVAALEWGKDRIRINSVHPNMVFDTALWTPELLASRAKHYGLSIEAYKTNNVLRVEVTSRDVAELAAEMCGPLFAKTTASQVPVDGGNERVI